MQKLLAQLYLVAKGSNSIHAMPLGTCNKNNPIEIFSKISSEYFRDKLEEEER